MLPWSTIYELSAKDLAGSYAPRRVARTNSQSSAVLSHAFDLYTVPNDGLLLLTNASARVIPGAADGPVREVDLQILTFNPTQTIWKVWEWEPNHVEPSGTGITAGTWNGYVFIMAGESIRMDTVFTGAAAANFSEVSFSGILIPRGDWQFG